MAKPKTKKQNNQKPKTESKKPITAYTVIRAIMITLVCLILLLGIAARIWHYYNIHYK
jgi:hypothetical protein